MKLFYFLLQLAIFCQVALLGKVKQCRLQKNDQACLVVTVTKVLDGATVKFIDATNDNATSQIIHLYGISGPSLNSTFQKKSKIHLRRLLGRKKLILIIKKSKDMRGGLGTFYRKGRDINKKMISDGYAWCNQRLICPKEYRAATAKAILKRKGVWKTSNVKKLKGNKKDKKEECSKVPKGEYQVSIVKVIDGDTIQVHKTNSSNKSILKVRMSGIDAPEMKQFFGMESKKYLQQLIDSFNTTVFQLYIESVDVYCRKLAILKSGVVDINKSIVESGHAWCYKFTQCPLSYRTAMANAKSMKKGLFAHDNPMTPWDWRYKNKIKNSVFR